MEKGFINIKNISLEYDLEEFKINSFKEYVLSSFRKKTPAKKLKALTNINFQIKRGESLALIGANGAGKSTLLKVIAGVIPPQKGSIETFGRISPMIELGSGFDPELSGLENIYLNCTLLGLKKTDIDERLESILSFSELHEFIHMPVKNYSSGMQARLGFACTTAVDPDILIVDEVLSVGDSNFSKKCLKRIKKLQEKNVTFIMVSHDLNTVRTFCDRGLVFEKGKILLDTKINEAISFYDELMEKKYLASLPKEERQEIVRMKELSKNDQMDNQEEVPRAQINFEVIQDEKEQEEIDLARSFKLIFYCQIKEAHKLEDELTCGFCLKSSSGAIVTGSNNILKNIKINKELLKDGNKAKISFVFSNGIAHLCAGTYELTCGIHDKSLKRTIFCKPLGEIKTINSLLGKNFDAHIINVDKQISDFVLETI